MTGPSATSRSVDGCSGEAERRGSQERETLEKLDTWRRGTPYERMLLEIGFHAGPARGEPSNEFGTTFEERMAVREAMADEDSDKARPRGQLQTVIDFLDAWRFCPVASSANPSRDCLENAAKQLLDALQRTSFDVAETDAALTVREEPRAIIYPHKVREAERVAAAREDTERPEDKQIDEMSRSTTRQAHLDNRPYRGSAKHVTAIRETGTVNIAYCPEHGLHGERETCFTCGLPVIQVPMRPVDYERGRPSAPSEYRDAKARLAESVRDTEQEHER